MKLEPIADRIQTGGIAILGDDLFIANLPAEVTRGVLLRQTFAGTPINHEIRGFFKTEFICICRAPEYTDAEALMKAVTAAITIHTDTVLGDLNVRYLRPKTLPITFPISDGALWEFNVRFEVCFDQLPA